RRIDGPPGLAPGAARRDEGEGARALPRRGAPLLRGAGEMRRRPVPLLIGLIAAAAALASDRARGANAPASVPPPPAPSELAARAHEIDALFDAWRFRDADAALATLKRTAPNAPETGYLGGYQKFLLGDYDGAVRALGAAAQAVPGNQDVRALADLAREARDAI